MSLVRCVTTLACVKPSTSVWRNLLVSTNIYVSAQLAYSAYSQGDPLAQSNYEIRT